MSSPRASQPTTPVRSAAAALPKKALECACTPRGANELARRGGPGSYVGCIAGVLSFSEYQQELTKAGFVNVGIEPTHLEADQMYVAIIRATKP